jgi:hypothetical protein
MSVVCSFEASTFASSVSRTFAGGGVISDCAMLAGGSTSGTTLWPTSTTGAVDVFDKATGARVRTLNLTPRAGVGVTAVSTSRGSQFLVAGGMDFDASFVDTHVYSRFVNVLDCFGSVSNTTLSAARGFMGTASYRDASIFVGGIDAAAYYRVVDIYNHTTNSWSIKSLNGSARRSPAVGVVGRYLVVAGGSNFCFSRQYTCSLDVVEVYDLEQNFASAGNLLLANAVHDLAVTLSASGDLLMAGGESHRDHPNPSILGLLRDDVVAFSADDLGVALKERFGKLSLARTRISAATIAQASVFAGGITKDGVSNVVDVYDASRGTWSALSLPDRIGDANALRVAPNTVVFVGVQSLSAFSRMAAVKCTAMGATTMGATTIGATTSAGTVGTVGNGTTTTGGNVRTTAASVETGRSFDDASGSLPSTSSGSLPASSDSLGSMADASLPLIIGASVGGLVAVILIALVVLFVCRRRRTRSEGATDTVPAIVLTPHTEPLADAGEPDTPGRSSQQTYVNQRYAMARPSFATDLTADYAHMPASARVKH